MTTHAPHWTTTAVTALPPGWVNVYRERSGTYTPHPCPALLLQEQRDRTGELLGTRVEAAEMYAGQLIVASGTSNYVGTFGPDEQWVDEDRDQVAGPHPLVSYQPRANRDPWVVSADEATA